MNILSSNSEVSEYFVSCNPLKGIFHVDSVQNTIARSGQPILIHGLTEQVVLDLVFSEYTPASETNGATYTPLPVLWTVYEVESEALEVVNKVNEYSFIEYNYIEHPTLDKWAVPANETVFNFLPEGSTKDWLYDEAVSSDLQGQRYDTAYLISDGWV